MEQALWTNIQESGKLRDEEAQGERAPLGQKWVGSLKSFG